MRKYSVTYKLTSDPSESEQASLIKDLTAKQITVLDHIPSVLSVSGDFSVIKTVLSNYSQWVCSPNARVSTFNI